ncbi:MULTISPECIES: hypothetical protein [Polaromonas]
MKRYPAIEIVVKHGHRLAMATAILISVFSYANFGVSGSYLQLVAGMVLAVVTYGLLRVGAEIVEVVADTLLPK